ncbi:MAG: riboflavin synthase subunit alpha [Bdellovibrionales bacterium RIFCSPHIGHO2_01_FULL_40_29]|nr:MAG: riboflavin synthase subunit alpha [Bdellovibrionales bacterium RIFCSPHIGHO2_01_FULL_40_29]OFZ33940.1 MAG: riboflavin synthase subunit alpha [Bdellovibrionales bacterium RIFCSPHIGHO2_02_FULL_40_15]
MFSGIIQAQSKIIKSTPARESLRIDIARPSSFKDLQIGDSISTNGVCLTVEKLSTKTIRFCLGSETLKVLSKQFVFWKKYPLNLEQSLQFGSRVHGHLVTGHVDAISKVLKSYRQGDCWQMELEVPTAIQKYFWKKGSVCLNGVSLTVNEVKRNKVGCRIEVCLIPETIQSTNLAQYKPGDFVNIEADYLAKAYIESRGKEAL